MLNTKIALVLFKVYLLSFVAKISTWSSCHSKHTIPPIGAFYYTQFWVPLAGKQSILLHINSVSSAHLKINGVFDLNETLEYKADCVSGKFAFELSDQTLFILSKFKTKLCGAYYHSKTDTSVVTLKIFKFPSSVLKLKRVYPQQTK